MILDYIFPKKKSEAQLDRYLAAGFFRNSSLMHRSELLCFEGELHTVVRVRMLLRDYMPGKRLRKMVQKNKGRFRFHIQPQQVITQAQNELFKIHNQKFDGFVYPSLQFFLAGIDSDNPVVPHSFPTWEINIYEGNKLVAFSYFDLGKRGMASLLGAFDPDYEKCSLGIFSMMLEIEFAKENGLLYYYPGYVLDATPKFDYKLKLGGRYQYYNKDKKWEAWQYFDKESFSAYEIRFKSDQIQSMLEGLGLPVCRVYYALYEVGYKNHINPSYEFVKYPLFFSLAPAFQYQLAYDHETRHYVLFQATEFGHITLPGMETKPPEEAFTDHTRLLVMNKVILETPDIMEIKGFLLGKLI